MRQFPPGLIKRAEELPPGILKRLGELSPASQDRALEWLNSFHFTELDAKHLRIDAEGGVFYADSFQLLPEMQPEEEPAVAQAAVPVSPFPPSLVFHSKPGAPNVLYLDFDGEVLTGTRWNTDLSRSEIRALPFSSDSDYATFSDSEQAAIKRIWQRVAEDYAPFNVNVTTERPASFGNRTAHALITKTTDANGQQNPSSSAGGVAYVNVFNTTSYSRYRPVWIYHNNLGNSESYIAEATAHELGHNLGLSHDGTASEDYYGGHGTGDISWGPIMGTGYGRNVSQWSKGDYYQASNFQDDLAIVAGKLSYVSDDHSDLFASATPLQITSKTNILATTMETDPSRSDKANKGIIERNTDADCFAFFTGTGPVNITVAPWKCAAGTRGGNLDLVVELYDESGVLILSSDPLASTIATLKTNLSAGDYVLRVYSTGVGDPLSSAPTGYTRYGSIGQYYISGTVAPSASTVDPSDPVVLNMEVGPQALTLSWPVVQGRLYSVLKSSSPTGPFEPVAGAVNLPASVNSITEPVQKDGQAFYRLQVQ